LSGETQPAPAAPAEDEAKKPSTEETLAQMRADLKANQEAINLMAEAIVNIDEKLEGLKAGGEGTGALTTPKAATTEQPQPTPAEEQKPTTVKELLAEFRATREENKKSIDLMAQAIVGLNEKIEAKPNPKEGGDASEWLVTLKELAGGGKESSLKEAAKSIKGLVKFAEYMDRFRHPYDYEGALAKRLLWRQGMRSGGIPRYMTKEEMKRYDKELDQMFGLEGEEGGEGGETEHVR